MRLLFVTQAVDSGDAVLGAYHGWLEALAERFERVEVICLFEGTHSLPANVRVHSLGKETGARPALAYAFRFLVLAWKLRKGYDAAFVHMNQEYLLLAGWLWKLLRKPAYLWRNHYSGSWLTDIAAASCAKVFCTSKHSYTAKYRKAVLMPVGVDTKRFSSAEAALRVPGSILFLARMSPSKRPDMLVDALGMLEGQGVAFTASFYGSALPKDEAYLAALKEQARSRGLSGQVLFHESIPNAETPDVYRAHEIFVNCSPSGMFDKTLFEAAASGCLVLAASDDFASQAGARFRFADAAGLASGLAALLSLSDDERVRSVEKMRSLARSESLATLVDRLAVELAA